MSPKAASLIVYDITPNLLIVIMIGAIGLVHGKNGFFLGHGPDSTLATAGFEYNLALIGLLAPILIAGPANCRWDDSCGCPRRRAPGVRSSDWSRGQCHESVAPRVRFFKAVGAT